MKNSSRRELIEKSMNTVVICTLSNGSKDYWYVAQLMSSLEFCLYFNSRMILFFLNNLIVSLPAKMTHSPAKIEQFKRSSTYLMLHYQIVLLEFIVALIYIFLFYHLYMLESTNKSFWNNKFSICQVVLFFGVQSQAVLLIE